MLTEFHFIRPYWLLAFLPFMVFAWLVFRNNSGTYAWGNVCDSHLLPYLIQTKRQRKRQFSILILLTSAGLMILSLSGPSWSRFPVPTYQPVQPRVLLLDLSEAMLEKDVLPNRLGRAKFKLHDLLVRREAGQFGLLVYTGEPFVVSPLTDDSQTIDALLSMLSPDIMPVSGHRLDNALTEAARMIKGAGFNRGNILVLTARAPTTTDLDVANSIQHQGIDVSIMPVLGADKASNPLFQRFASAGGGQLIPFSDTSEDIEQWLNISRGRQQYRADANNQIPVWRDQGRVFLIPALLLLLPVFRRCWLQRISS